MNRPEIVCLCGSTRFFKTFDEQNTKLTLEGKIVLSIGCHTRDDKELILSSEKTTMLIELHKRKIDMCDSVLVINVGGYIGESTRSEIEYALKQSKPVKYLERHTKIKIWTYSYNPFVMGGCVNSPCGCEMEVGDEIDLGRGYKGYKIFVPYQDGKIIMVEKESGAIIGTSLEEVKNDIVTGDPEVMKKQVHDACEESKHVKMIAFDEFWKTYNKNFKK